MGSHTGSRRLPKALLRRRRGLELLLRVSSGVPSPPERPRCGRAGVWLSGAPPGGREGVLRGKERDGGHQNVSAGVTALCGGAQGV